MIKVLSDKKMKLINKNIIFSALFFAIMHGIAPAQGIPQVYIELHDGKKITNIDRETKIFANMRVENANGSKYASRELYDGMIRIKGRGNSSWNGTDKKSYSIDLVNIVDKKIDIPLLGMPADADWILYASYFDKTFLRNYFSYDLATAMGHWASRSRFIELFINGDYRGLYAVCENIKKGENRVDVGSVGNSGTKLTGGYIFEQDYPQRMQAEGSQFIKSSRLYEGRYYGDFPRTDFLYFGFKYPADGDRTPEQTQYITDYIAGFEAALYGTDFADPDEGYRKYIDVNSFVDWYIISELAADWDHSYFLSSCWFTKPQGEKLKIGPVWDFDVGYKTSANDMRVLNNNPWIKRLWEDETFRQLVFDRFVEVIPMIENSLSRIENMAAELARRGAIDRNFEKWDILGKPIWTETMPIPETYEGEIRKLTQWIRQRYLYISTFGNSNYCEVLKRIKPAIRIIDQDVFDKGEFPVMVESSSLRTGVTPYYVWNNVSQGSRQYQINDYGKYTLTIRMGTCESLPAELNVKRMATVTISDYEHVYDGTNKSVNVLTDPPSLPVLITYNGETEPPSEPGTYRVDAEIDDADYRGKQVGYMNITKVSVTGIEIPPEVNPLRAWTRDGLLHVTGLTFGETISVYTVTGMLVYQNRVTSDETDIALRAQGVYVVRSGKRTVVVVFN